jgi:hypothetical protein
VTDASPSAVSPTLDNFDVCATFDGPIGEGETKAFPCFKTGRYVIVLLNSYADVSAPTNMTLTLCEVKVFTGKLFMQYYSLMFTKGGSLPLSLFHEHGMYACASSVNIDYLGVPL